MIIRALEVSDKPGQAQAQVETLSRDLRAPLRKLRQGLTILVEAREVTDEWVGLIAASGVECDEPSDHPEQ